MGWNPLPMLVYGCDITHLVTMDEAGKTWFNGRQWSREDWGLGDDMYPTAYLEKSKEDEEKYGLVEPYAEPLIATDRDGCSGYCSRYILTFELPIEVKDGASLGEISHIGEDMQLFLWKNRNKIDLPDPMVYCLMPRH